MAATADKTKPYIPLAGGAHDGWSKEDEATATCFCGSVQLSFVRLTPSIIRCPYTFPPPNNSNPSLPKAQAYQTALFVTVQIVTRSQPQCSHLTSSLLTPTLNIFGVATTWQVTPSSQCPQLIESILTYPPIRLENIQPIQNYRYRQHHDQLLLLHMRNAYVPCQLRFPRNKYSAHWHYRRFQFATDEDKTASRAICQGST